ncbi:16S rRNA (uracil(1498)-N(3))-methyltransferase [Pontiella agarivorans]|uniref:Ribosomal RNA small subunit methyltransferase E n=1 Tax=Pontiella agarivorans TaxID=3038953 RepID=A0ABU5MSV4_9BACT|nr:RsmE family RNA methyltransferase [Pontiella agarivorans]MDZ8117166.1 RsmE family RNA methyltransferase [Pontiella agarivorans]
MNLILLHPDEVKNNRTVLTDARAKHIRKVLKAAPGKSLRVGVVNGPLGHGVVERIDSEDVELVCSFEKSLPARPKVDLLLAMPRPKVLKRLWAQFAALGVGKIVLLRAGKVERCYFDSHVIEPDFYVNLLLEGLQQARCTHLPEVQIEPLFKPYIEDRFANDFSEHWKLLADPSGKKRIRDFQCPDGAQRTVLAVGPEGGWTDYELEMLRGKGFALLGMGDRILRTDTAVVGLLSLLHEWAE